MKFIKSLFNRSDEPILTYSDFWNWFLKNENYFFSVIKNQRNIPKEFFNKLAPKLNELKDGFWYLAGMYDDETAELIITADGVIKNIVFVEELVAAAPRMQNWKITALKQPSSSNKYSIKMDSYTFSESTMNFYPLTHDNMPDEIDIVVSHQDFRDYNKDVITNGVYIALDNSLGELNFATTIDNISIVNPKDAEQELIPIEKLKDYLVWRQKEFVEKYSGTKRNTENDNYSGLEGTLENNLPLIAIMNMDLLDWDHKASHPWILNIEIKYNGNQNNGMPVKSDYQLLENIENDVMELLIDKEGYLNLGRETGDSTRNIYFACKEFRKPSTVVQKIKKHYNEKLNIDFNIYKDKYWRTFDRFISNQK